MESWWNSVPSNSLQKLNIIIAIIGVAISLVLSGLAVHLTIKYGEDKSQIDTLTKMLIAQQSELTILKRLNTNSGSQLTLLKTSNDNLVQQTTNLKGQLVILSSNQKVGVSEICYTLFRGKLTTLFAGIEMQPML